MNFQKIALKIAYWLVAFSILVLIGFTFFARQIISGNSQSTQDVSVEKIETEESTNIEIAGMSMKIDNEKAKEEVAALRDAMKKDEEGRRGKQ